MKNFCQYGRVLSLSIIVLLTYSCNCKKGNLNTKHLRTQMSAEVNEDIPAIMLSVYRPCAGVDWIDAVGLSDKIKETSIEADQVFRVASVTKTFVAASILRLHEEGLLNIDNPIINYISPKQNHILQRGGYDTKEITVRHLLNHSSGMGDHVQSYKYGLEFLQKKHHWTRNEQVADMVEYGEKAGAVGSQFAYSDTGYVILGGILEKLTGMSMGDAFQELLGFRQLKLYNTFMEDYDGDTSGRRIHQYHNGVDTYDFHPSLDYFGGGGLLATTDDLSHFMYDLFNGKVFKDPTTLAIMLSPVIYATEQPLDYRMGLWKTEVAGKEVYTHMGFWGTQTAYIPDLNAAVTINYSQHWPDRGNAPLLEKVIMALTEK